MPYKTLNPDKIIKTAEVLEIRIRERFPDSSLANVAGELVEAAKRTNQDATQLAKPITWLRWLIGFATMLGALMFVFIGTFISFDRISDGAFDFVQGLESSINTIVLVGIGLVTLATLEERIKRGKVLDGLHSLRSLVHIIDMHQLTKDPARYRDSFKPTPSSPEKTLSPASLIRYLDYCSEMLSITGKLSALYAQAVPDAEVVNAVNDVEALGINLSRKIWQKISIVEPVKMAAPRKRK